MLKCLFQLLLNLHPVTEMSVGHGNPTVQNSEFIAAFHLLLFNHSGWPIALSTNYKKLRSIMLLYMEQLMNTIIFMNIWCFITDFLVCRIVPLCFLLFFLVYFSNEILKPEEITHSLTKSNWNMNTKYETHFVPGNDRAGRKQF